MRLGGADRNEPSGSAHAHLERREATPAARKARWTRLLVERRRAGRTAAALAAWGGFLRPGVYIVEESVARRADDPDLEGLVEQGILPSLPPPGRLAMRNAARRALGAERRVALNTRAASPPEETELGGFQGAALLLKRRKVLIMDPTEDRVLHAYYSSRRFQGHADRPDVLLAHIPGPRALHRARDRRVLVESLVRGRERGQWTVEERLAADRFVQERVPALLAAARATGPPAWGKPVTPKGVLAWLRTEPETESLARAFARRFAFDAAARLEIPTVHGHGDLRLANLVITSEGFVALDWEFSRLQPFFFDALHWLFMEWRYHRDPGPIADYFQGRLDDWLREVFNAAGAEFDPELRELYFGVYLADRLYDRGHGKTPHDRARQASYYRRFLDRGFRSFLRSRGAGPPVRT